MEKMGETVRAEMKTSGAFDQMRASLGEMVTDFNTWQGTKSKLRAGFVDGMKAALSEPQSQKWPAFERFLSREKTLPRSTISGEGVNLFIVLDEAGLSKETFAKLQPIMDEYELQLDQALKARNDFLGANEAKYLEAIQSGDSDAAKRFASRAMELRQKVREVNDRYREAICGQLEAADATRVRAAALAAGFERVYGSNRMKRAFEGALKLEDISQEVIDAIKALEAQYDLEVSPLNDRIAQEIRKEEPARQTEEMVRVVGFLTGDVPMSQMFRGGRGGQGDPDAQSNKLLEQRGEMNDSFMNRLEALLTPEQREQLPRGGRGGQGGGMGGMFGGGGGPIKLADMPEQARERMKPFDKNNDGTIDDTEREAMIQEFRQRGGGFFGGGGGGGGGGNGGGNGGAGGRGGSGGQGGGQGGGGSAP
jgi:hypothetical protein